MFFSLCRKMCANSTYVAGKDYIEKCSSSPLICNDRKWKKNCQLNNKAVSTCLFTVPVIKAAFCLSVWKHSWNCTPFYSISSTNTLKPGKNSCRMFITWIMCIEIEMWTGYEVYMKSAWLMAHVMFLHCSADVDECVSNPCPQNMECVNTRGSFSCECALGYDLQEGRTCTQSRWLNFLFLYRKLAESLT